MQIPLFTDRLAVRHVQTLQLLWYEEGTNDLKQICLEQNDPNIFTSTRRTNLREVAVRTVHLPLDEDLSLQTDLFFKSAGFANQGILCVEEEIILQVRLTNTHEYRCAIQKEYLRIKTSKGDHRPIIIHPTNDVKALYQVAEHFLLPVIIAEEKSNLHL